MAKINIMALGGLDEASKNLLLIEIDSKIFIMDSGMYEPLKGKFGIQHFIPKLDYLETFADKVKGIFLTSGNKQDNGAISEIIKIIPHVKIYGSKVTIKSLELFFEGTSK
jgi:ribonuclease J